MASSVDAFRAHYQAPPPIAVTLPDSGLTIDCKCPDLLALTARGWVRWPALQRVFDLIAEWNTAKANVSVIDNRPLTTPLDQARVVDTLLDEWVCAAAVNPKVVLTDAEAGPTAIWVRSLSVDAKMTILAATKPAGATDAVTEFRGGEPGRPAAGPSGEAVRDEAVGAAAG